MKYYANKIGIFLTAIVIVFIGFILIWFRYSDIFKSGVNPESQNTSSLTTPEKELQANLTLNFGNGRVVSYPQIKIKAGETAYSILLNKMGEVDSQVKTKKYDFGMMVESIDNISANESYFWSYLVNGQSGSIASDKYVLKDGDTVEWKYIKIQ